jgi:hypothetical protein
MAGYEPGDLMNSYSKRAAKTEFDITTAERGTPLRLFTTA